MKRTNHGTIITQQPSAKALIEILESNKDRPTEPLYKPGFFQGSEYGDCFDKNKFEKTRQIIDEILFHNKPSEPQPQF